MIVEGGTIMAAMLQNPDLVALVATFLTAFKIIASQEYPRPPWAEVVRDACPEGKPPSGNGAG